jgi:hypothetical protein
MPWTTSRGDRLGRGAIGPVARDGSVTTVPARSMHSAMAEAKDNDSALRRREA